MICEGEIPDFFQKSEIWIADISQLKDDWYIAYYSSTLPAQRDFVIDVYLSSIPWIYYH